MWDIITLEEATEEKIKEYKIRGFIRRVFYELKQKKSMTYEQAKKINEILGLGFEKRMADLYLERIGLVNPTIVERNNNGKIERLESVGLDMASLVAFWRRCFDLDGFLFEKITLHCKSKDFNAMGGRPLATVRSVRELLAEQGVECVIDDEWFKNHEVKNEEVEYADRVLTNACNKFAKRTENYEKQIKQISNEKSIAIMPTPKGCCDCHFHVCKYQHPFCCKEKTNRKGYTCQLDEEKRVLDLDINDEFTTANWCPLKSYNETE